jgi:hypothetical protein
VIRGDDALDGHVPAFSTVPRSSARCRFLSFEDDAGQPGLKNLTAQFLEEWFWCPAAIASYSAGRFGGVRSALAWRDIPSEMGMVVVSSTTVAGPMKGTLGKDWTPVGDGGGQGAAGQGEAAILGAMTKT